MNDEIKEIIDCLELAVDSESYKILLNYITNLQQEIEKLNDDKRGMLVELYKANDEKDKIKQENERLKENNSNMQEEMARTWEKCDDLQQENERLKEDLKGQEKLTLSYCKSEQDYKSRCEKAKDKLRRDYYTNYTQHNDDVVREALNILQNGDEEK